MTRILCLTLAVLAIAGGSCAMHGTAPPPPSQYQERDTRHQEILLWHGKIIDYRKEMGLSDLPNQPMITPRPDPLSAEQCLNVCDLAERICEAQKEICHISDELGPDDRWAREKCSSAKDSCKEAKKRCSDCQ